MTAIPGWCPVHQHRKWCQHNGGVWRPEGGYGPPDSGSTGDPR